MENRKDEEHSDIIPSQKSESYEIKLGAIYFRGPRPVNIDEGESTDIRGFKAMFEAVYGKISE